MPSQKLGRRPRKTRTEIYNAALSLFKQRGVNSVTMQDIADHAETARSTVFNHYPTKNDLLFEFFDAFSRDIFEATKAKNLSGLQENMYALFDELGVYAKRNARILKDIAHLALGPGPLAEAEKDADSRAIDFLLAKVKEAMKSGEISRRHDGQEVANLLLALLTVTNHEWVNNGQKTDLAQDQKRRFDMLVTGLRP